MELWLSVMSMVMLLIVMLGQKRVSWVLAFANLSGSFEQNIFNRTISDPTNRPVLPGNPIIPPITYDTVYEPKTSGGRKSRQFEDVRRLTFHPEIQKCPICQGSLRLHGYLNWRKHIQTLTDQLYVSSRGAYCDACQNQDLTYLSVHAAQLSLPNSTYGLDILVKIGYLRDYYRLPYHLIRQQLPPHIQVSTRHLSNLSNL